MTSINVHVHENAYKQVNIEEKGFIYFLEIYTYYTEKTLFKKLCCSVHPLNNAVQSFKQLFKLFKTLNSVV